MAWENACGTCWSQRLAERDPPSSACALGVADGKASCWQVRINPHLFDDSQQKIALASGVIELVGPSANEAVTDIKAEWEANGQSRLQGNRAIPPLAWLGALEADEEASCAETVTDDSLVLLARWDVTNVFHTMEDMITMFEHALLLQVHPRSLRLLLADASWKPDGPFFQLWSQLFSPTPPRRISDLDQPICAAQAVLPIFAGASIFGHPTSGKPRMCGSAVVRAFADYVRAALGVPPPPPRAPACTPAQPCTVIWIDRTEPANATHRYNRQLSRDDTAALIQFLRDHLGVSYSVVAVDLERMAIEDQIRMVASSRVLMGAHGAGLTLSLFLPRYTAGNGASLVVELPTRDVNLHYHNMATALGHAYAAADTMLRHSAEKYTLDVPLLWRECLSHALGILEAAPTEFLRATRAEAARPTSGRQLCHNMTANLGLRLVVPDEPHYAPLYAGKRSLRVLLVGDSLTKGYLMPRPDPPADSHHPYARRLRALLTDAALVTVVAESGYTARQITILVEAHLTDPSTPLYDVAIVLAGTNDVGRTPFPQARTDLCDLHKLLLEHLPRTVALTLPGLPPSYTDRLTATNTYIAEQLAADVDPTRVSVFDLASAVPHPSEDASPAIAALWLPDGVHFTPTGYDVVGESIFYGVFA